MNHKFRYDKLFIHKLAHDRSGASRCILQLKLRNMVDITQSEMIKLHSKLVIFTLFFILQSCTLNETENSQKQVNNLDSYQRIINNSGYGYINAKGKTIIPIGKYRFLNPIDDQGMILATNLNNKQGYIDINEKILIPFIYDDLGVFSCNLAFAKKDNNFGYINREGETIIDFKFSKALYFYNPGLAVVKKKSGWGLIDTLGNIKVKCTFDKIIFSREEQIAAIRKKNKWAFYFCDTETLTNFEFDEVIKSTNKIPQQGKYSTFKELYFNRNLALVKRKSQYALINKNLEQVVKYGLYDKIEPMNCYGYSIVSKDNKYGIIDSLGKLKVPLEYDLISNKPLLSYGNEFTSFLLKKDDRYQILNNQAELAINKIFNKVNKLVDNFYLAYENNSIYLVDDNGEIIANEYTGYYNIGNSFIVRTGNKMGTIDYKGNVILPFIYDSLFQPNRKNILYAKKQGKFGVINIKGKALIPFEYEYIDRVWYNKYKEFQENFIVQKNGKLGTINMNNEIIIPIKYDGICSWIENSPDEHYVKKGGKYGMVKPNGEILIPCLYDYIHYYYPKTILVEKNGKYGIITRDNKTIVLCEYEKLIVDIDFWEYNNNYEDKIVILKGGQWDYYDLNGKLINKNIPEKEIYEKYPYAKNKIKFSLDRDLILAK